MDFIEELLTPIEVPEKLANLHLPDPTLMEYYHDAERRVFFLDGDIDDNTLDFVKAIFRYNAIDKGKPQEERRPIKIFINTSGGDVQVMWCLINAIKLSKTPVFTIAYCNALSAGAHILAAGHKRYALPGSTILVHSGSCQYGGDIEKVESAKKYYDNLSKTINEYLVQQTNIAPKDLKKRGAADWYMSAEDAVQYGIIDAVINDLDLII